MLKPYVFVTRKLPGDLLKPLLSFCEVNIWDEEDLPVPREVLKDEIKKADALLSMLTDQIDEDVLAESQQLKIVANLAVGYDNIDIHAATKKGIYVTNTPDVLTDSTADLTFSLLLMTARRLYEAAEFVKTGKWKSWSPYFMAGTDVHHKTVGIVGLGKIGEAVAKRAKGFDMEVIYFNRNRREDVEKQLEIAYKPLNELIQIADFVVNLTPLTKETIKLFNRNIFKNMKNTAIFINAGRGKSVDENDLYEALVNGEIAGCGLDVFDQEPIDENHPLLKLTNVVALPHIGSSTVETRTKMIELAVNNIHAVLSGNRPITLVNMELLK